MLVFDIESDGLLDTITKIHCINVECYETGEKWRFTDHTFYQLVDGSTSKVRCPRDGNIYEGLVMLQDADCIGGQNVIRYDIPAIQKIYPQWEPFGCVRDSRVEAKSLYPDIMDRDFMALRKGRLPRYFKARGLIGRHSLEAWGLRIGGELKDDFKPKDYGHTWATMPFTKEMDDYCAQDVSANVNVFRHFDSKPFAKPEVLAMDNRVEQIIWKQIQNGVHFDEPAANALVAELMPLRAQLSDDCRKVFLPWFEPDGAFAELPGRDIGNRGLTIPKKTMKRFVEDPDGPVTRTVRKGGEKVTQVGHYKWVTAGQPYTKIKLVVFNPGSRDHIASRFIQLYGWKPVDKTDTGKPKVDEEILGGLPYPEAPKLAEYFMLNKRLGQIAEGKTAWLKCAGDDGKIHGDVDTLGTITTRMAHKRPNLAQVPKVGKPYGKQCRALFGPRPGWVQVGMDADSLEGCCLGHYLAPLDSGAYIKMILEGDKSKGTDLHSKNRDSVGLNERDNAKTIYYGWMYGAGDYKLGLIYVSDMTPEQLAKFNAAYPAGKKRDSAYVRLGKRTRKRLVSGIEGMETLLKGVQAKTSSGWLKGIDGRRIRIRSKHAALNTLLQGAGAIIMKKALVIADAELRQHFQINVDFHYLLNVHDEIQVECRPEIAEEVGQILAASVPAAGEALSFRCPLKGSYDIGKNWSETH